MAQLYKFFNSIAGDPRYYYASDFAEYFGDVLSTGLLHTDNSAGLVASVETGTMNTIVSSGKAIMRGHRYVNTTSETLTHRIAEPTLDRIDRIVLRLNLHTAERNILLHVIEGDPAEDPVAPTLQRDNYIHEISLAQVLIRKDSVQLLGSDLVDERLDDDLCGLVYSLISIPTDQLQAFITAKIGDLDAEMNQALADYLQAMVLGEQALQAALDDHLTDSQTFLDSYEAQLQANLTQFETDFDAWFDGLKDQLDGNVAVNLQNQINIIANDVINLQANIELVDDRVTSHLTDVASQDESKGASLVGFSSNQMAAENVREALLETFMLGNSTKEQLVDKLLLLDESLPITYMSTWQEVLSIINTISTGLKQDEGVGTYSREVLTVTGLDFKPKIILLIMQGNNSTFGKASYFEWSDNFRASTGVGSLDDTASSIATRFTNQAEAHALGRANFDLSADGFTHNKSVMRQVNLVGDIPVNWYVWGE